MREPLLLDDLEKHGATRFGKVVRCVWMELVDGRMVKTELPVDPVKVVGPGQAEPTIPKPSAEVKRIADAIVAALAELKPGEKVSKATLAVDVEQRTGEEVDYKSGTLARAIRFLKSTGQIPDDNTEGYSLNP